VQCRNGTKRNPSTENLASKWATA